MKVKVYFDNAEERYKIYNGDTVINATTVTINEIAIDEQLSDTSANAVENRTVKKALDDNKSYSQEIVGSLNKKVDANKSDSDNKVSTLRTDTELGLNALNSRIDEVIGQGMRLIKGTDFSWTWVSVAGNSNNFQLPANTVNFIAIPRNCTANVKLNGSTIYSYGSLSATNTQIGMFVTGDTITDSDNFSLEITVATDSIKALVESDTILLIADSPQELKDIRVDYFGFNHATAGDSVRSILNTIQNGKLNIDSVLSWTQISSATYTGSAQTEAKLPTNTDINITLPPETVIAYQTTQAPVVVGDITATEEQHLVFTTDSYTGDYRLYLSSNSLAYSDLIEAVSISMDFNIFIRKDTEMSDSSENVVQNKVIKEYIDKAIEPFILTDTAKGSEITLNDSVDRPIKAISIMGKSTQDGTPTIDNPIPIVDVTSEEIEVTNGTDTQTAELDITLRGIPVSSGGNYTDNDGQEWICDTIERYKDGTGKLIQRVREIILNGTESWQNSGNGRVVSTLGVIDSKTSAPTSLCSGLSLAENGTEITNNDNKYFLSNGRILCSPTLNGTRFDSTTWVTYLSSNNLILYTPYDTPVETPLTAEEIAELDLDTYYPTTNINSNTDVVVEYVCTTQGYIDKRLNN